MTVLPLRGRVAIRELHYTPSRIVQPDGYAKTHERDRTSHRGLVLAMGPPAQTRKGVDVVPDFQPGDVVLFVFDAPNADLVQGGGATEQARTGIWPADGGPCVWICQEEVIALEEGW